MSLPAKHERFAHLVAEGDSPVEAYRKLYPDETNEAVKASNLYKDLNVRARVAEIRDEVNTRSVLVLTRKRELLRQMAEGIIPTKVTNGAQGVSETFDRLLAIQMDAKLAGEFEDVLKIGDSNLKLQFTVGSRGHANLDPETIEAQLVEGPIAALPDTTAVE